MTAEVMGGNGEVVAPASAGGPVCPAGTCDGSGFVMMPSHCAPGCRRVVNYHAPECPILTPVACDACVRAALGDDLQWQGHNS